ncbi:single-stranded DNA-binding protein [Candidatus Microgenomates bacterium]|nr:single-stranded DNA-binding protein [Candidatus Microgenomates bacterium]
MAKSLNKVQLIGNMTRDPELKFTPSGTAVCTFSIATNRQWTTDQGEKKDEADFHRIVSWSKLAEICGQLLKKGRKVYVEGRLQTRSWEAQDGTTKYMTEVVISDMILLDSRGGGSTDEANLGGAQQVDEFDVPADFDAKEKPVSKVSKKDTKPKGKAASKDEGDEDIPF